MKSSLFLLLVGVAVSVHAAGKLKEVARVGNKVFYIGSDIVTSSDTNMNWEDAVSFCNANNMNLPTFKNKAEWEGLHKWQKTFARQVYIGASDKSSEGTFYWESNRGPIKYSNWGEGEPATGEYNSCGVMDASDGKWRAYYCDVPYAHVVCEKISTRKK